MHTLSLNDPRYPQLLREIPDPPKTLYIRGNTACLTRRTLSVVGTRTHTSYATNALAQLLPHIVRAGIITVSGLAYGVDAIVARETLRAQGATIAILGSGIDDEHLYPAAHRSLAQAILKNDGLLISEYPPETTARKHQFIARNRIIAGLSSATLIVEAPVKSGALITADFAMEQGHDVLCLPGAITSPASWGTNTLIKEGATIITCIDDVFDAIGIPAPSDDAHDTMNALSKNERLVLEHITPQGTHIDTIIKESTLQTSAVLQAITTLEMHGRILETAPSIYSLKNTLTTKH